MNLRDAKLQLQANIMAGNATVLVSGPGWGKSEMVEQLVKWFATKMHPGKRVGWGTTFLARQSSVGAVGLPWKGQMVVNDKTYTITDPAVPLWFLMTDVTTGEVLPADQFDVCFWILEEWGQGDAESKRAFAQGLLKGEIDQWKLPLGSARIALSNMDARDGITKEFDFVINRRGRIEVSPDVDVWIEDFADKPYQWGGQRWAVMPFTKVWAHNHGEILFEKKPDQQGEWCSPRSLTSWDRYAQCMAQLSPNGEIPGDDPHFVEGSAGIVGMPCTQSLISELQFTLSLPPYETVVAEPRETPIPDKADLQMLMAYTLASRAHPEDSDSLVTYMSRKGMAKDMQVTFINSLLRRAYADFINVASIQAWVSKNASWMAAITAMADAA